jgi:hypothetical protein
MRRVCSGSDKAIWTYHILHSRIVTNINQYQSRLLQHGVLWCPTWRLKRFQGSELFQIFLEEPGMLLAWAKEKKFKSEMYCKYLLTIVIPYCQTVCNKELKEHGLKVLKRAEFMKFVRLKTLDVTTAWPWLKQLGFTYSKSKLCYYTNRHEKAENVIK